MVKLKQKKEMSYVSNKSGQNYFFTEKEENKIDFSKKKKEKS
jgi:hypothetical protein